MLQHVSQSVHGHVAVCYHFKISPCCVLTERCYLFFSSCAHTTVCVCLYLSVSVRSYVNCVLLSILMFRSILLVGLDMTSTTMGGLRAERQTRGCYSDTRQQY